jgi:hypothetical protein
VGGVSSGREAGRIEVGLVVRVVIEGLEQRKAADRFRIRYCCL